MHDESMNPFLPPMDSQRAPQEVYAMIQDSAVLFDVRETGEFGEVRIPNAINLPVSEINSRWQEIPSDKEVILHCRSGHRSGLVVNILRARANFPQLYNLDGGLRAWYIAGLPIDTTQIDFKSDKPSLFEEIGVKAAYQRMQEQVAMLIDVREEDEFAQGHPAGAINLPLTKISQSVAELQSKGPLMLICDEGIRSDMAAAYLVHQGVEQVANVAQGVTAWRRSQLPWE